MPIDNEDIKTLTCLGLTGREARVYLALLRLGTSKAESISAASLVHRQEIYRVVESLQQMGLVETALCKPTLFIATPINEALKTLIQRKSNEFEAVVKKSKSLVEKLEATSKQSPRLEDPHLSIISEGDKGKRFENAIENASKYIEIVTTNKKLNNIFLVFNDAFKKALAKNVVLRVFTEKPENKQFSLQLDKAILKKPHFKIMLLPKNPPSFLWLFDNNEAAVAINSTSESVTEHYLWTNSSNIVNLSRTYLEDLYTQTKNQSPTKQS